MAGAGDPTADSGIGHLEDPSRGLGTEAFSDGVQDLGGLSCRRPRTVKCGVPSSRKLPSAGLAVEIPDRIMAAVVAVTDEGMDGRVSDLAIVTVGLGQAWPRVSMVFLRPRRLFCCAYGTPDRAVAAGGAVAASRQCGQSFAVRGRRGRRPCPEAFGTPDSRRSGPVRAAGKGRGPLEAGRVAP